MNLLNLNRWEFLNSLYQERLQEKVNEEFNWLEILEKEINKFERRGFIYINPKEDFYNPSNKVPYVLTPSGSKLTQSKINRRLRKIIIGNKHQKEAILAWECYMLNDIHYNGF